MSGKLESHCITRPFCIVSCKLFSESFALIVRSPFSGAHSPADLIFGYSSLSVRSCSGNCNVEAVSPYAKHDIAPR